MFVTN